jgi:hypothetical protein
LKSLSTCLAAVTLVVSGPAFAETLRVGGVNPAASDAASALRTVAVEQFGGEAGPDLSFKIEDVLRAARLRGQEWVRVVPGSGAAGVEATLRGTAHTEQRFVDYTEERERCIKDDAGKCTSAKEKVKVRCKRRTIDLMVRMRLVAPNGALVWSDDRPESQTDSWCEDSDREQRARGAVARSLADRVAMRLQGDFVPREFALEVRLDENRKGLAKADADLSKAALKKVRERNFGGACADWRSISGTNPAHLPTLYNVGLCAESAGDYAAALEAYRKVNASDSRHDKAQSGLGRIAARERAQRQIDAHNAD